MYAIIGIVVGLLMYRLIITPIERRKARKWCIEHGLVPEWMEE